MNVYDVIGIGAGPANLSLAALLTKAKEISSIFLEKRKTFDWHPGMLLSGSKLQVEFINDLVTMVDPTNYFSFLNFLVKEKRLCQFIAANFDFVHRKEFNKYLQWVFASLENIASNNEVIDVKIKRNMFELSTKANMFKSKNIVIGTGITPYIPKIIKKIINNKNCLHSSMFLNKKYLLKVKQLQ